MTACDSEHATGSQNVPSLPSPVQADSTIRQSADFCWWLRSLQLRRSQFNKELWDATSICTTLLNLCCQHHLNTVSDPPVLYPPQLNFPTLGTCPDWFQFWNPMHEFSVFLLLCLPCIMQLREPFLSGHRLVCLCSVFPRCPLTLPRHSIDRTLCCSFVVRWIIDSITV